MHSGGPMYSLQKVEMIQMDSMNTFITCAQMKLVIESPVQSSYLALGTFNWNRTITGYEISQKSK